MIPEMNDHPLIHKIRKRRALLWGSDDPGDADRWHEIVETLRPPGEDSGANTIRLFVFREQWGYCLHLWVGNVAGMGYGPFLSFCDPYPTRHEALCAASAEVLKYCEHSDPHSKMIAKWATSLVTPQQLSILEVLDG